MYFDLVVCVFGIIVFVRLFVVVVPIPEFCMQLGRLWKVRSRRTGEVCQASPHRLWGV